MKDSTMKYINIKSIYPHKDNPRKDLGDLTELAESIKAKGVLQNLTVVPRLGEVTGQPMPGMYIAVIGHRRLAAAKLAGLEQVPCVISDMNEIEQIATMLLENMQRNDLTLTEQANGFQMMIDLGDNISSISEKTGLSATTIRHRVKLTELDQTKLTKAMGRGATLMDFAELEKIKDVDLKNKVLESIGTNNFKWELSSALDKETEPERKAELIEELSKFATQVEDSSKLRFVSSFCGFKKTQWYKEPEDKGETKYFFLVEDTGITLYKEWLGSQDTQENEPDPKWIDFNDRAEKIRVVATQAYQMRYDFVQGFTGAKKYTKEICKFAMTQLLGVGYDSLDSTAEFLGLDDAKDDEMLEAVMQEYTEKPEYIMLVATYCGLERQDNRYYWAKSWEKKIVHQENDILDAIYDGLTSLGYVMSDDEIALRDGTHELFKGIEEEASDES